MRSEVSLIPSPSTTSAPVDECPLQATNDVMPPLSFDDCQPQQPFTTCSQYAPGTSQAYADVPTGQPVRSLISEQRTDTTVYFVSEYGVSSTPGQLSLPFMLIEYWPAWLRLRRGAFPCVRWQVTLCDPIWQVTLRSG